jgi:hypothetical protein
MSPPTNHQRANAPLALLLTAAGPFSVRLPHVSQSSRARCNGAVGELLISIHEGSIPSGSTNFHVHVLFPTLRSYLPDRSCLFRLRRRRFLDLANRFCSGSFSHDRRAAASGCHVHQSKARGTSDEERSLLQSDGPRLQKFLQKARLSDRGLKSSPRSCRAPGYLSALRIESRAPASIFPPQPSHSWRRLIAAGFAYESLRARCFPIFVSKNSPLPMGKLLISSQAPNTPADPADASHKRNPPGAPDHNSTCTHD